MRYAYPYVLEPQPGGGWTATFPDVPEAITQGDTEEEVAAMAEDALVTALSFYTDEGQPLPYPFGRSQPPDGDRAAACSCQTGAARRHTRGRNVQRRARTPARS